MISYMKKPCKHCPFRNDIRPYLHPDRAAEIAFAAENPYQTFHCHQTTVEDEDSEDCEMLVTENSKECAGFLTLRAQTGEQVPKGFKPAWTICYTDSYGMIDAYEEEWNKQHK